MSLFHLNPQRLQILLPRIPRLAICTDKEARSYLVGVPLHVAIDAIRPIVVLIYLKDLGVGSQLAVG